MKVYFASDHAGFVLKNALINLVRGELGHDVEDCGAFELDPSDDYPDFIGAAAGALSRDAIAGLESRAILFGASGQGEAIAANRFRAVRCAVYYGASAHGQTDAGGKQLDMLASTREHNDSNALSIGARFISQEDAERAVREWLSQPFSREPRHVRRIEKLDQLA